jgi:DNA-binding GntR family transcriptional regulator
VRLGNAILTLDSSQTAVTEAIRIRKSLDPLLIEDALWHASPADLAVLRERLAPMADAVASHDPIAFVHANWQLHAEIAAISPNQMLRSIYGTLLAIIESHTLSVLPGEGTEFPGLLHERYRLHADLIEALERRDAPHAAHLITAHNTGTD